jgi:cysteine desulfurase
VADSRAPGAGISGGGTHVPPPLHPRVSVYLDHAATTPLSEAARAAMEPFLAERFGNASEPHRFGLAARRGLEEARAAVAGLLDAEPRQVVFTSGGSEADNQGVFGLAGAEPGRLVVSAIEHPAVREPARELERRGFEVAWAPVDGDGVVDADAFAELVQPGDRLAAVMWANNVTGAVQPVARLAAVAAERGVRFHCDAVQAAASFAVGLGVEGIETLALSAHKLGGPKGVGCLVARHPGRVAPLVFGGGQEGGLRSGTENVAGIAGFAAALAATRAAADRRAALRARLEAALPDGASVVSAGAERLPGHALVLVSGVRAELLVLALDRAGYAVAAGSACAAGDAEPSHVLVAQGLSAEDARSVVRVSLGLETTAAEVDGFGAAFAAAVAQLRRGGLEGIAAAV